MTSRESAVRVGLVYPELLGTYGDRGNAIVLVQRCRWRGIPAELVEVRPATPIPDSLDVYLFGGGEDDPQLDGRRRACARHAPTSSARTPAARSILAVCAGFQLLGHRYDAADGDGDRGRGHRRPRRPRRARAASSARSSWSRRCRRPGAPRAHRDAHRLREPRRPHDARRRASPARPRARRRRQRRPHCRRSVRCRRRAVGAPRRHVPARPGAPAEPRARRPSARLDPTPSGDGLPALDSELEQQLRERARARRSREGPAQVGDRTTRLAARASYSAISRILAIFSSVWFTSRPWISRSSSRVCLGDARPRRCRRRRVRRRCPRP